MLAEAAALGVPIDLLLKSGDQIEVALLEKVVAEASKVREELDTNLARKIVNEYSDAKKRGDKKGKGKKK